MLGFTKERVYGTGEGYFLGEGTGRTGRDTEVVRQTERVFA